MLQHVPMLWPSKTLYCICQRICKYLECAEVLNDSKMFQVVQHAHPHLNAPVWNYHSEPQVVRKRFCICILLCCNAAVRRFLSLVLTFNELLVSHIFTRSQIHQLRPLNIISGGGCTTLTSAHSIMPHFLDVQPFSKLVATEQVQAKQWSSSFNMFQLIITLASFVKASFKHPSSTVCGTRMNSYWLWVSSLMDCNTAIPTHYTGSDS